MVINWVTAKAQQLLPVQDAELDELNANFDLALSVEIRGFLYAQNDDCMDAGGTPPRMGEIEQRRERLPEAVAEARQQAEIAGATTISRLALDEHELALA